MCQKGSMMVEAAMVIPMVILIVFAIIYLMLDFYQLAVTEALTDQEVFKKGFEESLKVRRAWAAENILNR